MISSSPEISSTAQLAQGQTETLYGVAQAKSDSVL